MERKDSIRRFLKEQFRDDKKSKESKEHKENKENIAAAAAAASTSTATTVTTASLDTESIKSSNTETKSKSSAYRLFRTVKIYCASFKEIFPFLFFLLFYCILFI